MIKNILIILISILIQFHLYGQDYSDSKEINSAPFYFEYVHSEIVVKEQFIEWFRLKENQLKSIKSEKSTIYYRPYEAVSEKYFRVDSTGFKPLPFVEYVYDRSNGKIKEIHYEWDIKNYQTNEEKQQIKLLSNKEFDTYIRHFKNLSFILDNHLGKHSREGTLAPDSTKNYYTLEATDKWRNQHLSSELYIILSNINEKKGVFQFTPTHRIRCKIIF